MSTLQVFYIKRSQIEARLDPHANHPRVQAIMQRLEHGHYPVQHLFQLASFKKTTVTEICAGTIYIGLENIENSAGGYVATSEKESISSAAEFNKGDILFPKLRPYLNKTHLAEFDGICSTEFHVLKPHGVSTDYLATVLRSDILVQLTSCLMTGNTLPRLQTRDIEQLPIPLPSAAAQQRIVDLMCHAYAEKKRLEAQASVLLASLDAILFQSLDIKIPPKPESTVGSRIFTVKQNALSGWRFDPAYFEVRLSVLRQAIQDGKNNLMPLGKVCAFLSNGRTPAAVEYSDSSTTFPVIKVASYQNELIDLNKAAYSTCPQTFAVQKGDVFVLSAAHQPDYVGRFVKQLDDEPLTPTSFVGELICLRANRSMVEPDYLFSLFSSNTFQNLLNCEKRGQTSHIYPSDIKHILIPVPSANEQVQIAERFRSIRNDARNLRHQADLILQQAKQSVENLILGKT